jgi:hypothetical protein
MHLCSGAGYPVRISRQASSGAERGRTARRRAALKARLRLPVPAPRLSHTLSSSSTAHGDGRRTPDMSDLIAVAYPDEGTAAQAVAGLVTSASSRTTWSCSRTPTRRA